MNAESCTAEVSQKDFSETEITDAVVYQFYPVVRWCVVPNVSWGMGVHECDIFAVSKSGWVHEVEVKISVSDVKADLKKRHCHDDRGKIKHFWFALPLIILEKALPYIPEYAGIYTVERKLMLHWEDGKRLVPYPEGRCYANACIYRRPKPRKHVRALTDSEMLKLYRLAMLRFWSQRKRLSVKVRRE